MSRPTRKAPPRHDCAAVTAREPHRPLYMARAQADALRLPRFGQGYHLQHYCTTCHARIVYCRQGRYHHATTAGV